MVVSRRELLAGIPAMMLGKTQVPTRIAIGDPLLDLSQAYEAVIFAQDRELRFILHDDNHPLVVGQNILSVRGTIEEIRKSKKLSEFLQTLPVEFSECEKTLEMIASSMAGDPNYMMNEFYSDSSTRDIPKNLPYQLGIGPREERVFKKIGLESSGQRYDVHFRVLCERVEDFDEFGLSTRSKVIDLVEFAVLGPRVAYSQYDPLLLRRGTKTEEEWNIHGDGPFRNYYWKFSLKDGIPLVNVIDIMGVQSKLLDGLKNQVVAYDKRERNLIIF